MITEKTYKALKYLKDHPNASYSSFAMEMWPDSNMHTKSSNTGNGACRGKAAWLCAGSYIGKLKSKKLVWHSFNQRTHSITRDGEKAMEEFEKKLSN